MLYIGLGIFDIHRKSRLRLTRVFRGAIHGEVRSKRTFGIQMIHGKVRH